MKICILGANGRVSQKLISLILQSDKFELATTYARSRTNNNQLYKLTYNLEEAIKPADILIDFTSPELTMKASELATQYNKAHIIGTTGFDETQLNQIKSHANYNLVLLSYNMSYGINLLLDIIEHYSHALSDFDAEILELHHRYKRDAPSGTALALGNAIKKGRESNARLIKSREGADCKREKNDIGLASIRAGKIVGEHEVIFASDTEVIKFSHQAQDRTIFAHGALRAAEWLIKQEPGRLYHMRDILG